ncbi:hypothetical protein KR059_012440, partial [Drosophila kikkawai]
MPVLEMALVWANFYHGLRRCFGTESRTVATQLTTLSPQKKSQNRRRHVGIGRSLRTSRRLRKSHLIASDSELQDFSTRESTVPLTSCQEVTCFEVESTSSSPSVKRQQLQKQLQERPLIMNAIDVIQVKWSNWWQVCWPALVAASVQVSFGSPRLCHSLMGLYDEEDSDPPILVLACSLAKHFKKLCQRTDIAICNAGPGPFYRTTSATMELIDIQQINEALVDCLV